jgi:hypothetical protein
MPKFTTPRHIEMALAKYRTCRVGKVYVHTTKALGTRECSHTVCLRLPSERKFTEQQLSVPPSVSPVRVCSCAATYRRGISGSAWHFPAWSHVDAICRVWLACRRRIEPLKRVSHKLAIPRPCSEQQAHCAARSNLGEAQKPEINILCSARDGLVGR